jgi:hypothetical protein
MGRRATAAACAAAALALLAGCVYPKTVREFDDECKVVARRMVLDVQQVDIFERCLADVKLDCTPDLIGAGVLLATSTVVSGSIALAGNALYWLEKKQRCQPGRVLVEPEPVAPVRVPAS